MLQNEVKEGVDLVAERDKMAGLLPAELRQYVCQETEVTRLSYPVLEYPTKVSSLSLDKQPVIEGTLMGIKGQYLLFDQGKVINIRKHNGYFIRLFS